MKLWTWMAGLALAMIMVTSATAADLCSEPVMTSEGAYRGRTAGKYETCSWKGIPFAKPPVGELRLKRPEPPAPHMGVKDAYEYGAACLQKESITMGGTAESYSEDCLTLNIWRPKRSGKFPVMVWFYGGGFMGGAGSFEIYDGSHLATREDVVVVTMNYRLGALGYMALPELKGEDAKGSTGNYGIQDQVRSLEWVRDNISAFGGDPDNVTVFGQSAGGMSICVHLVSPESRGLFHRAMMMSAPCRLFTPEKEAVAKSRAYAADLGCTGEGESLLSCLRAAAPEQFNRKAPNDLFNVGTAWAPAVDGSFLPDMPIAMMQRGEYQKVPVIISTTRDELRSYTMTIPGLGLWSRIAVKGLIKLLTGPNAERIFELYSFGDFRRPMDLMFTFLGQMTFETPMFMMAEAMSGNNPVYLYRFDWDDTRMPHHMGAFHALDVPFVFGALNMTDMDLAKLLASRKTYETYSYLGGVMMDYVGAFAHNGDPNGHGLPAWPPYASERRERLIFDRVPQHMTMTALEVERYRWFAERDLREVLQGPLAQALGSKQ